MRIVTASSAVDEAITIDGGSGNDTLIGGNTAEQISGGIGNDNIDANRGDDVALLGSGSDTFRWDPGDGNDTVEGGADTDALVFNGANIGESIDVSANGGRVRFLRSIASVVLDLDDVEGITFNALGGADTIIVNDMAGTDLRTFDANLAA